MYKLEFKISFLSLWLSVLIGLPTTYLLAESVNSSDQMSLRNPLPTELKFPSDAEAKKAWRRLLYYKKNVSEINSKDFFIAPKGRKNPDLELKLTIHSFFSSKEDFTDSDQQSYCKFPARFYFLNKALNQNQLGRLSKCTQLNEFLSRVSGESASLVFSSYFIDNPSSAFGHTFLKINKSNDFDLDLMNYGINFAATADTNNAMLYAMKGLFGLFKGEFTAVPYYYKVREYNDFESRDLWEYQLDLTSEELFFLSLHIWELGQAWSRYYYLDRNCSYWALRVLEAIKPNLELTRHVKSHFVIPIETVKSLYRNPNFVKSLKVRKSLRGQLLEKLNNFAKKDIDSFKTVNKKLLSGSIAPEELRQFSPEYLDTQILFYDYKNADFFVAEEERILRLKQPLLVTRSKMESKSTYTSPLSESFNIEKAPHKSHPPRRVSTGFNTLKISSFRDISALSLKYKLGFHELVDSTTGFNQNMGLNYFDFSALIYEPSASNGSTQILLDHFYLIKIDAFTPVSILENSMSWRLKLGYDSELMTHDWLHKVGFARFATGYSRSFLKNDLILGFIMLENQVETSAKFDSSLRYSLGPLVGFKININSNFIALFEAKTRWFSEFNQEISFATELDARLQNYYKSWNTSFSAGLTYVKVKGEESLATQALINYYF